MAQDTVRVLGECGSAQAARVAFFVVRAYVTAVLAMNDGSRASDAGRALVLSGPWQNLLSGRSDVVWVPILVGGRCDGT